MQLGIPTLIQAARRTHICQKRADVGHRTGMDFPPFAKSGRKGGARARFDFLRDLIDYQCVRGMERRGGWSAMLAFATSPTQPRPWAWDAVISTRNANSSASI